MTRHHMVTVYYTANGLEKSQQAYAFFNVTTAQAKRDARDSAQMDGLTGFRILRTECKP